MDEINKIIKIDRIDRKILSAVERNARIPITILAKEARVSRAIAEYRLRQLEKKGIIRGYYCLLDPSKFGLTVWKLWVSLRPTSQKERKDFFDLIEKHPRVWWYAECAGIYDAVICVLAKTPHEFNDFFNLIQNKHGEVVTDSSILINVSFEYHTRGFLLNHHSRLIESAFQQKPLVKAVSKDALEILRLLSINSRINYAELGQKTKKNVKTIKKTIEELKKSGIIVFFRSSIDVTKIGYEYYKVLLYLHNPRGGIIPSVVHWCREQQNITAIIFCVGPWQLELEVEIDSFRNLCDVLTKLKDQFPEVVKHYEALLITKEGSFELDLISKISKMD
ncbi:MAG TPA: Lrp/AsnC family transcriptional regulator [Candidatus Nanoarchaeia archaeon]|nr:Lrp/AsnC family transcriptional regulator [Candidatus Nanoarchaeia archaeon]